MKSIINHMKQTTIKARTKKQIKRVNEDILEKNIRVLEDYIAETIKETNKENIGQSINKIMYKVLAFTTENKYYEDILLHRECKKYFDKCNKELIQKIP